MIREGFIEAVEEVADCHQPQVVKKGFVESIHSYHSQEEPKET